MLKSLSFFVLFFGLHIEAKIYDCFMFCDELELLAIRLEELDPVVDHFIIVEGASTFSGHSKPLYFDLNRHLFEPYLHKIIHLIVDVYPPVNSKLPLTHQPWVREQHQRNAILRGLNFASDEDIVLITDVDEIPTKKAILFAQKWMQENGFDKVVSLQMSIFRYQLNRFDPVVYPWKLAIATSKKMTRRNSPHDLRLALKWDHSIPNSGWHFTSQGGLMRALEKFMNYSHANDPDIVKMREEIAKDFDQILSKYPIVPIDETWPIRIQRLLPEFVAKGWVSLQ